MLNFSHKNQAPYAYKCYTYKKHVGSIILFLCLILLLLQELLYAGAEGNAVTWNGATPLMRAIESGKVDVVKFLLDCNVNMIMVNKKGKVLLWFYT